MKLLIASIFAALILNIMPDNPDSGTRIPLIQTSKPLFSFGVVNDVQYCNYEPEGVKFYRSSLAKLREATRAFKSDSVSFILNLGDLIDRDFESYKPVLDILDSSRIQVYHVSGNHDYSVDARFKKRLPVLKQTKEGYYSFLQGNFRFIFLNGNEISTYSSDNKSHIKKAQEYISALKAENAINTVDWNGGLSEVQIGWLRKELDSSTAADQKVFLICHFPVVPENVHNLLNYKEVLGLLENYHNIIAWFNGHNHAGNYGNFNMIHFVTFKGMVETESSNSFAIVDVYSNKLWIRGYGREKSQILAY